MQKGRIVFLSVPDSLREQFIGNDHEEHGRHEHCDCEGYEEHEHCHDHEGHEHCEDHGKHEHCDDHEGHEHCNCHEEHGESHDHGGQGFSINPDIPIPAELPEGTDPAVESEAIANLSWEMILSGMLRVIQEGAEKEEWLDYYREFVLAIRPEIIRELTEAALANAQNCNYDTALDIFSILTGFFTPASGSHYVLIRLNRALVLEQRAARFTQQGKKEAAAAVVEAVAAYNELLTIAPSHHQVLYCGGLFFLSQKDYSRARECFSRYIEISDNEENKKKAEGIVREIINRDLEDEDYSIAYKLIQAEKPEEAMKHIRVFLDSHPLVWNGWFMLGWALRLSKRWEDGAAAFRKAIEAGRQAFLSGTGRVLPKGAAASSPLTGFLHEDE